MTTATTTDAKVVLITGASSGIGEAAARRLATAGHRVFAGARRTERLTALADEISIAGGDIDVHPLDVTRHDSVEAFITAALKRYDRIDVLINNAGVMPLSPMADLRVDEWEQMIDVNLRGPLYGIAAVLPHMLDQGSGHIINVSSVSGHRVDPTAAVYSGTKFALTALSEGLRQESRNLRVTVITPGLTRTELTHQGGSADAQAAARAAADQIAISPAAIAEAIAFAIGQPIDVDVNEIVIRPTRQG